MRFSRIIKGLIIGSFLLALASTGCTSEKPSFTGPVFQVIEDDLGRPVKLPGKIERAISLAPSLTEVIFAVGAGDKLVGVTTYCNYPEDAKAVEKVGDTQTPNIERIVALKPQVVFVSTASQLEAFMAMLDRQNIAVFVTNPKDFDGVLRNLRTFGSILGTEKRADELAADLERRVKAVDEKVKDLARPGVFVQISKEPLFTIGNESFLTEIVHRAGGISVTRDVATGYPKLSKETALAMNPEVIILSDSEDNRESNDVFKNSPAKKNGRVYRINADIISRPGPRLVDALEEIAKDLHP
jgi:iron complex transport system substrate-binding protein